ncbi:MAG: EamA family transporter [Rhodobacterales bacterium]|nr:MAG: EamA family transporter [Rhodobacterales bacterium]
MDIRALIMGISFALIWASAFTSARIIVMDASPMAALVICQNALYLGLNFVAMQTVEASLATIVASTMPLVAAFSGWLVFRDHLSGQAIAGLVVGLIGVVVIMGARLSQGVDLYGLTLCVLSVLALTIATLSMRGASGGGNLMMVVGLQMLVGAAVLAVVAALTETIHVTLTRNLVLSMSYTILGPGLLATWLWFALVARIGTMRASVYHFLTPFFGVAIAAILLGEDLTLLDIAGVATITIGIVTVQRAQQKPSGG